MKRILLSATVAALMAVMLVALSSAALAVPPSGEGETGCEVGKNNAFSSLGLGTAADDATSDNPHVEVDVSRAPYTDNPGEDHGGKGPGGGFRTAEDNTSRYDRCQ